LRQGGRLEEAKDAFRQALARCPTLGEAAVNLGQLLEREENYGEARANYELAAKCAPPIPEAYFGLGSLCFRQRRFSEAERHLKKALFLRPDSFPGWHDLGNAQRMQNHFGEALESYRRALALKPDSAEIQVNLANLYRAQNKLTEAAEACHRALALSPELAQAHINLSIVELVAGNLREGWLHGEYRLRLECDDIGLHLDRPLWNGTDPIRGKNMLLHGEQGLGDTLHFVRYVSQVAACGARIHLMVQRPLASLVAASYPSLESVIPLGDPMPEFDFHCPLASLPRIFGTELSNIPAPVPYLRVPGEKAERARNILGVRGERELRVGLVWAGNASHANDMNRSIPLQDIRGLLEQRPGVHFYALNKGVSAADREALAGLPQVTNLAPQLGDFADTAAFLEQMDLAVSVDTSVAHLAGALGKRLWLLLPFSPDWRWLLARDDSPWYPSARLFRQPTTGDWGAVIRRVKMELAAL
jgi:tetratricopeptide (TPR) repeat protein